MTAIELKLIVARLICEAAEQVAAIRAQGWPIHIATLVAVGDLRIRLTELGCNIDDERG